MFSIRPYSLIVSPMETSESESLLKPKANLCFGVRLSRLLNRISFWRHPKKSVLKKMMRRMMVWVICGCSLCGRRFNWTNEWSSHFGIPFLWTWLPWFAVQLFFGKFDEKNCCWTFSGLQPTQSESDRQQTPILHQPVVSLTRWYPGQYPRDSIQYLVDTMFWI